MGMSWFLKEPGCYKRQQALNIDAVNQTKTVVIAVQCKVMGGGARSSLLMRNLLGSISLIGAVCGAKRCLMNTALLIT